MTLGGRGHAAVPIGTTLLGGYDQLGRWRYVVIRVDGTRGEFPFRWQATAFANGWTPPGPTPQEVKS